MLRIDLLKNSFPDLEFKKKREHGIYVLNISEDKLRERLKDYKCDEVPEVLVTSRTQKYRLSKKDVYMLRGSYYIIKTSRQNELYLYEM